MVLEDCPTTKATNEYLKEKILYSFPILEQAFDSKYLSLKEYVYERPQKFYSKKAFEEFLSFLNNEQIKNSAWFKELYHEIEHDINIAVKSLNDVNSLNIHDVFIPDNNIECIRFIDNHIHFNYLKLIEAVYHKFLLFIAHNQRKQRNKATSGLDIYNCIEEVKKSSFDYLTDPYDNTVRNGIAHGGITYKDFDTVYKGKKGQPVQLSTKDIIKKFDNLLDVCNGLSLAFKIFVILNREYFQTNNLTIPKQFLIQELKALANAPKWQVIDCLENEIVDGRKQLNIFTKNQLIEHQEVNYYAFRTAIIAEYFARGFDRYFFSLESKYSLPGWAGYDGKILERERLKSSTDLSGYQGALEDNMLFFISKIKLPRLIKKIIRYIRLAKIIMPIEYHKYTNYIFKRKYELRETKPHRRGLSLIINDPSVYIYPENNDDVISFIRNKYKKITKYAIKESKKELSFWHRFLKTKYIRVTIYDTDLRKRHLRGSGLVDSLICSITVNRSKKIKNIDFIGGIAEQKGKYRIIWNGKWKNIKYVCQ